MNTNPNTNSNSIIAQALSYNRQLKNAKISAKDIGDYALARNWQNAVKALRMPAYTVAAHRHDIMARPAEVAEKIDQTPLYTALRTVLDLIGEVNGEKLNVKNCAEAVIGAASCYRAIDLTPEMAHARNMLREANKAKNDAKTEEEFAQAKSVWELWKDEVKRLESEPGNCEKHFEAQKENAFVNAVEMLLGDAINGQMAKSAETILAEELARKEARKAARKDAKAAKAAKAQANTEAQPQA